VFFTRPIAGVIMTLAIITLLWPMLNRLLNFART
jgi:TctA family transporter